MKIHESIAHEFALSLVDGDYLRANEMLVPLESEKNNTESLRLRYENMISYGESPAERETVEVITDMEDWPNRQEKDVGWAYVSICGKDWAEGLTIIVSCTDGKTGIRNIEWGRP